MYENIKFAEQYAMSVENMIRRENGQSMRTHYCGSSQILYGTSAQYGIWETLSPSTRFQMRRFFY